ncbi:MAG TPA: hypothetical protein VNT79_05995 [Phycisphaerae bacterium]|nr:hypothetical protein [Phycisphaerae bacterium]
MVAAPRPAFWTSYLLGVVIVSVSWIPWAVQIATVEASYQGNSNKATLKTRTMAQVWTDWHTQGALGPIEIGALAVACVVILLALFTSWLFLPTIYRGGSVWTALRDAFRMVASGVGVLTALFMLLLAVITLADGVTDGDYFREPVIVAMPGTLISIVILLIWLTRAARAMGGPAVLLDANPRCEFCGYDLTHVGIDGRCSECGEATQKSMEFGICRRQSRWQKEHTFPAFFSSIVGVIVRPAHFYKCLALRVDMHRPRAFSRLNIGFIGGGAAAWIFCSAYMMGAPGHEMAAPICAAVLLVSLIAWTLLRLVGSIMTSWALVTQNLSEPLHARMVLAYESAFLWTFCVWSGLVISSFMIWGNWISSLIKGRQIHFFGPEEPEVMVFIGGNVALLLLWGWRFLIAFRHTRWSNF